MAPVDEYVDGSAFIDLTENDVKGICNQGWTSKKDMSSNSGGIF